MPYSRGDLRRMRPIGSVDPSRRTWTRGVSDKIADGYEVCCHCDKPIAKGERARERFWDRIWSHPECGEPKHPSEVSRAIEREPDPCAGEDTPVCDDLDCTTCIWRRP